MKSKLLWPVSFVLGFWLPDYLVVCPHISLLTNKNFFDGLTGRSLPAPRRIRPPAPWGTWRKRLCKHFGQDSRIPTIEVPQSKKLTQLAEGVGFAPTVWLTRTPISSQNVRPPAPKTASGSLSPRTALFGQGVFLGVPNQASFQNL